MADPTGPSSSYLVLARKYRPLSFGSLIGQDAMVTTLRNAFETGRIPHAFILTGIRGAQSGVSAVELASTAASSARVRNLIIVQAPSE